MPNCSFFKKQVLMHFLCEAVPFMMNKPHHMSENEMFHSTNKQTLNMAVITTTRAAGGNAAQL